jgi:hypothetical protein
VTNTPTIVSGFAALAADPMALTGVVLLLIALLCGGHAILAKKRA